MSEIKAGQKIEPIYARNDDRHFLIRWGEKIFAVVATLVMWAFLAFTLYNKLYVEAGESLWQVMSVLGIGLLVSLLLLGGWQFYNWFLYRGKDRRKEFRRQSLEEVGSLYGISATDMAQLQDIRKAAVVQFRDHRYYYCIDGEKFIEIGMLRID